MKKIFFLILFIFSFSNFCFSQDDNLHHYTDKEITTLSNYINELEKKNAPINPADITEDEKKQIADILNKPLHSYTDDEIITLTDYIKKLEHLNAIGSKENNGERIPLNDSLHTYSDLDITRFSNYIKELETKISETSPSELNPEEQKQIANLLNKTIHEYTDLEVIQLANYIKHLVKLDSVNVMEMAKTKTHADSLQSIESLLKEDNDIKNFVKLVFFNFNSAILKKESYKPLDEVLKILKNYSDLNFIVEGHCDSIGPASYNLILSKRRAATVTQYFISKGISSNRISSIGYGEAIPIAPNSTAAGRARNRRVEIKAKK